MNIFEFLQKIEESEAKFCYKLCRTSNRPWSIPSIDVEIRVGEYQLSQVYREHPNSERGEEKLTEDFTQAWAEIETFIDKSIRKSKIDEEN